MIMPTITIEGDSSGLVPRILLEFVVTFAPSAVRLTMAHRPTPVTPNCAMPEVGESRRVGSAAPSTTAWPSKRGDKPSPATFLHFGRPPCLLSYNPPQARSPTRGGALGIGKPLRKRQTAHM